MINTLETTLQETNSSGRTEVVEIVNHKETDRGYVEEELSIHDGCVTAKVALYPTDCSIQKIEAKRKYEGKDPLEIRAKAAGFIHKFEENYCENHDECMFHQIYHNPKSTTGQAMKDSIKEYGEKSGSYLCSICSGYDKSCSKYLPLRKIQEQK